MFNELSRASIIDYENPIKPLRQIKISEKELSFLSIDQINELLHSIDTGCENPHVAIITRICLATGARWGEAESLTLSKLHHGRVTFTDTKSSKNRSVPNSAEILESTETHLKKYQSMPSSIAAFRRALDRCSFKLPKGQASHVLRHSFASHFIMNGGNILTLQRILGHSSVIMTMRYAHLAPEHLQEAINLNPINQKVSTI